MAIYKLSTACFYYMGGMGGEEKGGEWTQAYPEKTLSAVKETKLNTTIIYGKIKIT